MIKLKKYKFILSLLLIVVVCLIAFLCFHWSHKNGTRFSDVDLSTMNVNIKIERFEQDFYAMDTTQLNAEIARLQQKYGQFFDLYTQRVMNLGNPESPEFAEYLKLFLSDSLYSEVYKRSEETFENVEDIETKLSTAFGYVKYYFPEKNIPRVLTHVSGFNQSVVVSEDFLSLSIDDYLGADFPMYQNLVYDYQLGAMTPEKVPSDYMTGWLMSEFDMNPTAGNLLENMIFRGKIMYLLETFMPTETDAMLMAYSNEQIKWCEDNEANMWRCILEKKHLFTTDRLLLAKYISEAPFTADFPTESPGRAAIWIGWQIVRSYMKNNLEITLPELMQNYDYQGILTKSKYNP